MTYELIADVRRRFRRLVILVAGVAVLIAAAVYPLGLYVNSRLEDPASAPPNVPTVPTLSASPSDVAPLSEGAPPVGAVLVVLPADTSWTVVAGVALPVSTSAGPRRREHGLAADFARTPAGAVLAAVHLLVNTTPQVGPAVFESTLRTQVVGPHAAAMRAAAQADYRRLGGDPAVGGPVGSLPAALAGARLTAYTNSAAQVDLLTVAVDATGTTRFAATAVDVAWTGTDWALLAPPAGRWDGLVNAVTPAQAGAYPPFTWGGER